MRRYLIELLLSVMWLELNDITTIAVETEPLCQGTSSLCGTGLWVGGTDAAAAERRKTGSLQITGAPLALPQSSFSRRMTRP